MTSVTDLADLGGVPPLILREDWVPLQVYAQLNDPQTGMAAFTGVVLAKRLIPRGLHNFVVWGMAHQEHDTEWACFNGLYCDDLDNARFEFGRRLRLNCWGATVRGFAP